MSALQIAGAALLFAILILLLREWRPTMAPPLRLAATLVLFSAALTLYAPILTRIHTLFSLSEKTDLATPLLRAAGIALIIEFTASFCRDMGENTVAEGVSLFGKLEILLLSLPLLDALIAIAEELLK